MFDKPVPLGGEDRERHRPLLTVVFLISLAVSLIEGTLRTVHGVPGQMEEWMKTIVAASALLAMWFPRRPR